MAVDVPLNPPSWIRILRDRYRIRNDQPNNRLYRSYQSIFPLQKRRDSLHACRVWRVNAATKICCAKKYRLHCKEYSCCSCDGIRRVQVTDFLSHKILSFIRLRATNPGIWPFHCHQLFHNYEGMAVALYVKDEVDNKPFSYLPKNMPQCHNYHPKDTAINEEPRQFPEKEESSARVPLITVLFLILPFCLF